MRVRGVGIAGTVLAFLMFVSVALAQEPTGPAYAGAGPDIDEQVSRGQVAAGQAGALPFTGLDITLALLAGLLLVAMGLLTRRIARNRGVAK
ncbi:MAG: hypothetical protein QOJ43_1266 [Gaiellaceae bacterium]|jgi:hypothetical protein|nr:hypothetical protein [Gaiellaceae bacterium]